MENNNFGKSKIYDKPAKCEVSPYNVWRAPSPATNEVLHEKLKTVLFIMMFWKFIFSAPDFSCAMIPFV